MKTVIAVVGALFLFITTAVLALVVNIGIPAVLMGYASLWAGAGLWDALASDLLGGNWSWYFCAWFFVWLMGSCILWAFWNRLLQKVITVNELFDTVGMAQEAMFKWAEKSPESSSAMTLAGV